MTKSPTFDEASLEFFQQTMDNLLAAAEKAGVGHAVVLSIVGADEVPDLVYYRAKVLQEDILKAGAVPYSIVRATQFFEFIDAILAWTADEHTVRLPATRIQPMAAAEVAQAVADVAVSTPLQSTRNIAGPEVFTLDELGKITLAARGDHRTVITTTAQACSPQPQATPSSPRTTPSSPKPPIETGSHADSAQLRHRCCARSRKHSRKAWPRPGPRNRADQCQTCLIPLRVTEQRKR
ncbi:SDR family oxidoreductase [Saccharopolyspora shandongensis]|uniref:SDR family oxidoreductase n=1 Tax=Saccharopolyspora shandongensis TaxID=418495 RepID=UPI00340B5B2C